MAEINLNEIWEWNAVTGEPFVPPDNAPHSRYCRSLEEMDNRLKSNLTVGEYLKERVLNFMTSNLTTMTTVLGTDNPVEIKAFLRFIRALDLKKIHVQCEDGGAVRLEKVSRDTPFIGQPDGVVNHLRTARNDSKYGKYLAFGGQLLPGERSLDFRIFHFDGSCGVSFERARWADHEYALTFLIWPIFGDF